MISHFSQLLLVPLFPRRKAQFNVSDVQLSLSMTIFFLVSCGVQALCGFAVDRFGAWPILFAGRALFGMASVGYALSPSHAVMACWAAVAGVANGVFIRLITGCQSACQCAALGSRVQRAWHHVEFGLGTVLRAAGAPGDVGTLTFGVVAVMLWHRDHLHLLLPSPATAATDSASSSRSADRAKGSLVFLKIPAVWECFTFFCWYAVVLSVVQAFAPAAGGTRGTGGKGIFGSGSIPLRKGGG